MNLLQELEREQLEKLAAVRPVPKFEPGDTVRVSLKVVEGERERIQAFEGVCIARKNGGVNSNFTLRKISYGEGVERVFPLYSPRITAIEVVRRGVVRRAKLYYLRGLTGKRARITERARDSVRPAARIGDGKDRPRRKIVNRRNRNHGRTAHAVRQDLAEPCRGPAGRGHLPDLYRSAPDPRGHDAAGLRRLEACRAQGAPARRDDGRRRSQHPDHQPQGRRRRHRRSRLEAPGRHPGAQCAGVRRPLFRDRQPRPGHRPRHRARAGPEPARHDHRLRRQPHRDAWRHGRARLRHRHLRGRARAWRPRP